MASLLESISQLTENILDPASVWQNAVYGKLSETQRKDLRDRLSSDLKRASGSNQSLYDRSNEQGQRELTQVFAQADLEAEAANAWNPASVSGFSRWLLLAGGALLVWIVLQTAVIRWLSPR